jgi:hypothetical protein
VDPQGKPTVSAHPGILNSKFCEQVFKCIYFPFSSFLARRQIFPTQNYHQEEVRLAPNSEGLTDLLSLFIQTFFKEIQALFFNFN